jgi:phosphate transport system ATP-binding protein
MTETTKLTSSTVQNPVLHTHDVTVDYSGKRALNETSLSFESGTVTALIGPSGCGKSTFLRCINLMNREIPGCVVGGKIVYHDINVNTKGIDTLWLRKRVGMVFQQPNPFRKSIYENIAFALKSHGMTNKAELDERVEKSLRAAALWDEVKDKLRDSAYALSGGQQQRLCIARTLALQPDVVLMDEPCSALDPSRPSRSRRPSPASRATASAPSSSRTTWSRPRASPTRPRSSTLATWSSSATPRRSSARRRTSASTTI